MRQRQQLIEDLFLAEAISEGTVPAGSATEVLASIWQSSTPEQRSLISESLNTLWNDGAITSNQLIIPESGSNADNIQQLIDSTGNQTLIGEFNTAAPGSESNTPEALGEE